MWTLLDLQMNLLTFDSEGAVTCFEIQVKDVKVSSPQPRQMGRSSELGPGTRSMRAAQALGCILLKA